MKTKSYTFYSDAGHGWLKVTLKELVNLGIAESISGYSYMSLTHAYLEEDCDAPKFVNALKAKGIEVSFKEQYSSKSAIRNYASYRANLAMADVKENDTLIMTDGERVSLRKAQGSYLLYNKEKLHAYRVKSCNLFDFIASKA